jgi:hypothetical protein
LAKLDFPKKLGRDKRYSLFLWQLGKEEGKGFIALTPGKNVKNFFSAVICKYF